METGMQRDSSRLCDFIRDHRDKILHEWTLRARRLPVASELSQSRLIDHLPELLHQIGEFVRVAQEGGRSTLEGLPKIHALERLDCGFDLKEVVCEYSQLRACVLDLYSREHGDTISVAEVRLFDAAIDEAIHDSAEHYARQRMRVLAAVDRLTTSLPPEKSLPDLLDRLLAVFAESSEVVDTSSILLLEDEGHLRVRASIGLSDEVKHQWSVPLGKGFAGTIAATRKPIMLRHASKDPLPLSPFLRGSGIRALYGVPLIFNDELLGVAHMGSRTAFEFSDEDRALFRVLTTRAAIFIYENVLRENAERRAAELEATIEAIPGEVIIGDVTSGVTRANTAALQMMGVSSTDALVGPDALAANMNVRDGDSGRPMSVEELPLRRAMLGETVRRDLQLHHVGRNVELAVLAVAAPIKLHGEIVGAVCICLDMSDQRALETERERLLREIEEERERLLATLRQVPAGVVIADARSERIVLSNEAATTIWGGPFSAATARSYRPGLMYSADGRPFEPEAYPLARALRGESVHEEIRIHRFDGTWATCLSSAAPVRTRDGQIAAAVVTFIDITERKTAEEQFRAFADNLPQLAWIADENGYIYWYNRRWFEYTGTTLEQMKGWGWRSVHHPEHVERVVEKIKDDFAIGRTWEDTFPLRGKDGRYRWFLSRATPIRDESGRVVRWFGTNTDVTEQRRLEEAREQFVAILGHDLRNPLNAILMATSVLARNELDVAVKKSVVRIESSAQRMRTMISDLLDFTRGRLGGGIPVEPAPVDLGVVCKSVVDEIATAHPQTRIAIDIRGDVSGTWDGARLAQVVQNLVVNAIQHGDADAGVDVVVDGQQAGEVTLTVSNRGPIIPPELIPHLFEPFRRLAHGGDAGRSSLGLGLFIVSEIAEAHGGSVSVRSSKEEGTVFAVRLPRTVDP